MKKITQTAGRAALGEFAPQFAYFNDDVLFGENWNIGDIDTKTRSIITVAALIGVGRDRFVTEVPFAERKSVWHDPKGDRSGHHSCCVLCRLAEGMGGLQYGKRGVGTRRGRPAL